VEVHFRREEEQEDEPAAPVKKKRKFDKSAPVWKPVNPVYCGWGVMSDTASKNRQDLTDQLGSKKPVEIFEQVFSDNIIQHISAPRR
jgi:hypothetical protein